MSSGEVQVCAACGKCLKHCDCDFMPAAPSRAGDCLACRGMEVLAASMRQLADATQLAVIRTLLAPPIGQPGEAPIATIKRMVRVIRETRVPLDTECPKCGGDTVPRTRSWGPNDFQNYRVCTKCAAEVHWSWGPVYGPGLPPHEAIATPVSLDDPTEGSSTAPDPHSPHG